MDTRRFGKEGWEGVGWSQRRFRSAFCRTGTGPLPFSQSLPAHSDLTTTVVGKGSDRLGGRTSGTDGTGGVPEEIHDLRSPIGSGGLFTPNPSSF